MNKISVITVVYNNVAAIRQTMESFFAQIIWTWVFEILRRSLSN